jgi:uncharacterized protein
VSTPLHDQVEADLRTAMKARDKARTSALRMVVAALKNTAVSDGLGPQGRLPDATVQKVLTTEVKRRREAATAFADAGREEQAEAERAEAAVYAAYLPAQLSDEELAALIDRVIGDVGATGPQDLGAVMKAAMAETRGQADGSRVSAIAKAKLT